MKFMQSLYFQNSFESLSLKDLVEARDMFHYHLMSKNNVVGTAIGLYRIRKKDKWPSKEDKQSHVHTGDKHSGARTLFNSEVRPYSWPCVYVFVESWETEANLAQHNASDVVPKTLYLPDGRMVPVCVIEAQKQSYSKDMVINRKNVYPRNFYGPGTPVINDNAQGMVAIATAGCVVRDGKKYYVLTNDHALGNTHNQLSGFKGNKKEVIGTTSAKSIGRSLFNEVYPAFKSSNQYLHQDIGLIELNDVTEWKTDLFNLDGEIGNVIDLYDNSYSLKLIGQKVVGHGAVSGRMTGEIHGLFYRYKAIGGFEYLSDFLIGPETKSGNGKESFNLHHGDSGTLLMIEHEYEAEKKQKAKCYYPLALLWGKNEFISKGEKSVHPFALATALSPVLNQLELDFVKNINYDNDYIWGYIGHYAIGSKLGAAIELLGNTPELKQFVDSYRSMIAMADDDIVNTNPSPRVVSGDGDPDKPNFVPLADVPDNVWKSNVNFYMVDGGEGEKKKRAIGKGSRGQHDNPNHFADIDLMYDDTNTLLDLCIKKPDTYLHPDVWVDFYNAHKDQFSAWEDAVHAEKHKPIESHWGALPFRVWQIFNKMVEYVKAGKGAEFLCAAGVLIHYVGDACQPLHTSYMSQGDPDDVISRVNKNGKTVFEMRADKVHGGYEDDMVDTNAQTIMDGIEGAMASLKKEAPSISNGFEAAKALMQLIELTQKTIKPADIVNKWAEVKGLAKKERNQQMWDAFGDATITCMARGCKYLAAIWQAAWSQGTQQNWRAIAKANITEDDLMNLYNDPKFVPSIPLDQYTKELKLKASQNHTPPAPKY